MAAIIASRHKRARNNPSVVTKNQKRKDRAREVQLKKAHVETIFKKYDIDCSGSLDAHQLQNFIAEYAGRPVSEQAVAYIMKMAAAVSKDGSAVTDDDMMVAVATWDSFSSDLTKVLAKFDAFDADNSGVLSPGQVGDMLKFMNGGADVSQDEIDWIIECADDSMEGSLNRDEIGAAVAVWYGRVVEVAEESKSCACVIS